MSKVIYKYLKTVTAILYGLLFQSCFTGIEGTQKISLSKHDISTIAPTTEELLMSGIVPDTLKNWLPGKQFYVIDSKIDVLLESSGSSPLNSGDVITFKFLDSKISPDGSILAVPVFEKDGNLYKLILDKQLSVAPGSVLSNQLPLLTDLDMVNATKKLLEGKRVWTRSNVWTDSLGNYIPGKKYIPVIIKEVNPSNNMFPVCVTFATADGTEARVMMNFGNGGNESRSFARLFSLTDPRLNYPHISNENWEAICSETVRIGMTKDECRLSLGNPSDVNSGHDYSRTLEIWYYPNGSYLQFADGLLVNFRK